MISLMHSTPAITLLLAVTLEAATVTAQPKVIRAGRAWDAKDEYGFTPEAIPPLQDYIQKNLDAARRAVKAAVRIGMGSDAVYSMFGQNTRELGWFVKAGMTPRRWRRQRRPRRISSA